MSIPKVVAEAEAAAMEVYNEAYGIPPEGGVTHEETPVPEEASSDQIPVEIPSAEIVTTQSISDNRDSELARLQAELDTERQRFRTLNGKYEAEVPRLWQELTELKSKAIAPVEKAPEIIQSTKPPEYDTTVREYPEIIEAVNFLISQALSGFTNELSGVKNSIGTFKQTLEKTSSMSFQDKLTNKVPNWKAVDIQEGFTNWLSQNDPYTGVTFHQLLRSAVEAQNVERTARFFEDYIKTTTPPSQESTPAIQESTPKNGKSKFVQPAQRGSGTSVPTAKNTITQGQIQQFQNDVSRGKYLRNPAEADRIERDIQLAVSEGRVV